MLAVGNDSRASFTCVLGIGWSYTKRDARRAETAEAKMNEVNETALKESGSHLAMCVCVALLFTEPSESHPQC
ncbi:hypothetical protein RRG08_054252 [Elysia crispata]|uniref:Uncharacterized protein n=1 Tax=Elysia crispata TaxID=231223 RepID=A0AAE0YDH6_9GAST|nr:hypothetical protein RRG08_054252 [Elysia crispata]